MTADRKHRFLLLAPMRMELRPILQILSAQRSTVEGAVVHTAQLGDCEIVATTIGVGPKAAAAATERMLGAMAVDHVVVSGIAGGIGPTMEVGMVVAPETVIDLATGTEYRSAPLGDTTASGTIGTTAVLILDDERVASLVARGIVALDMETAGVAEVCQRAGVPWSAFRSISDRPQDGLLDDNVMDMLKEDGSADGLAAIRVILTHPWRIPALMRLGRDSSRAAKKAASSAITACSTR